MPRPIFSQGRRWHRRASRCRQIGGRVWHDLDDGLEYEKCPQGKDTWHQIDARRCWYRDIDPITGLPIPGREGQWRPLK